jgi:hypothetical protein
VGDIVVIRPTTQWGDEVAEILEESLNDDGSFKDDSISSADMFTDPLNPVTRLNEMLLPFIASGGIIAQTAGLTASFSDMVYYIGGVRYTKTGVANRLYTVSKDTYVDIGADGVLDYTEVANGATSPVLATDHIRIAKVVTNASAVTSVLQLEQDSQFEMIYPTSGRYAVAGNMAGGTFGTSDVDGATVTIPPSIKRPIHVMMNASFEINSSVSGAEMTGKIKINGVVVAQSYWNSTGVTYFNTIPVFSRRMLVKAGDVIKFSYSRTTGSGNSLSNRSIFNITQV